MQITEYPTFDSKILDMHYQNALNWVYLRILSLFFILLFFIYLFLF